MATRKKKRPKPDNSTQHKPGFQGWLTSDEDEIERRRLRGRNEAIRIEALEPDQEFFGAFLARSDNRKSYHVEIRSLGEHSNSCDCPDHRINGLGTCKHIEATLDRLEKGRKRRFREAATQGSPRIEIYLDRRDGKIRIHWPRGSRSDSRARALLSPFISEDGVLLAAPLDALPALTRTLAKAPAQVKAQIRQSRLLDDWLEDLDRRAVMQHARQAFESDVANGKRSLDMVNVPLYPYQQEGMLHLAFSGRALLADEMGLGKTVQAIAACELLRRLHDIRRVLVVAPASLKAEWEEQIAKFTGLPALIIQGTRAARLRQYREPAFFYLANYEQIAPDGREINEILAPDVIILDEAQRIKNWKTRTAGAVKRLVSRYAFVLTGTPIENRIDEIYSIVEFLNPQLFGPLFRFNRDFYQLDERGHPIGYKNLDELHRRLRPVMLRRRKEEVEGELPGLTVNTYFVGMAQEQAERYDEYKSRVARLTALAKRRPLTKEEMDKLQRWLACMRMLCDTPYILDRNCRLSPKLKELENILDELLEDGDHKIIIFSEWERMLELVREKTASLGIGHAWHTGSVPQPRRRAEIRRFKDDPRCRLFLSTDSGSVGLNLQVADVVINLDLPWNPAKLEQRIARAWRKHQQRPVQVINLVCEHSIEQRMLHLLDQKRTLAQGIVDGKGALREMAIPSGRAAFLEQLGSLMGQTPAAATPAAKQAAADPVQHLREDLLARWSERLELLEVHGEGAARTVLVVADRLDDTLNASLRQAVAERFPAPTPRMELLDRATFETLQRLIEAGVLSAGPNAVHSLHRSPALATQRAGRNERRLLDARKLFAQAERKQQMARVLADGGFAVEAISPLKEGVETALQSLAHLLGEAHGEPIPLGLIESRLMNENRLPAETVSLVTRLRANGGTGSEAETPNLLRQGAALFKHAAEALDRAALE